MAGEYIDSAYKKKHTVAKLTAEGKTQTQIAKKLKITQPGVSLIARKEETKGLIAHYRKKLLEDYTGDFLERKIKEEKTAKTLASFMSGDTTENDTNYNNPEIIEKYLDRQDKMGAKVLIGTGVLQSQSILNQFNQTNIETNSNNIIVSDGVQTLFKAHIQEVLDSPDDHDTKINE